MLMSSPFSLGIGAVMPMLQLMLIMLLVKTRLDSTFIESQYEASVL